MAHTTHRLPQELASILLPWYDAHQRPLPWRQNPTPYRVWVSEIMLQQTRIEAARGYFERFMAALPTVEALAAASEEQVLKLWEGLGYYSRARNLRRAAQIIVEDHGGTLPMEVTALRKLPGIGEYTAGAIASIAFDRPEPAVDGNVLRICARLTMCPDSIGDPAVKKRFHQQLREQYPATRCGDFTSAIMELGETVCVPGTPDCDACPFAGICMARAAGQQTDYPIMPEKKPRKIQPHTVFILRCGDRVALRQRSAHGLLAGLWELPNAEGHMDREAAMAQAVRWGCAPLCAVPCGEAVHIFTHLEWHMTGWIVDCDAMPERFVWADETERERYPIPTAFKFYRRQI